ncbi:MAG TPA: GWxTD domain-containing protein, partial [Candidatus Eisenbacteria bacterium]|nr:GWxTD domain-containing protein [Candidatus Eisenbacteria bacterium]
MRLLFRPAPRAAIVLLGLLSAGLVATPAARADRAAEAESLYQRSIALEARGTIEGRRDAMACLERATSVAPDRSDLQIALGRLYYTMGFLKQAKRRYQKVERQNANDPDARFGIAQVWRRDWLKYLDRVSLGKAVDQFTAVTRLRPGDAEAWLQLVPLLVERNELAAAGTAADRAMGAAPGRPETQLAVAYTSYRLGRIGRAESTFVAAIPRLPRLARERFEDIAPVASEEDTFTLRRLPPSERPEFLRRFWREHDPDLASRENEAQLEYWSRVAHAYFLFFNARRREWDERGEVYVRYGPPESADYNPLNLPSVQMFGTGPAYPLNSLVWSYPSLGMQVVMQDRTLNEYYLLPVSMIEDMDPHPSPEVLALRGDLMSSRGGRGVFPLLPPGAVPRPADGVLVRFSGQHGPRLYGEIETAGSPDDTLRAEWVVLDSAMREVARADKVPGVSGCDPTTLRSADFAA